MIYTYIYRMNPILAFSIYMSWQNMRHIIICCNYAHATSRQCIIIFTYYPLFWTMLFQTNIAPDALFLYLQQNWYIYIMLCRPRYPNSHSNAHIYMCAITMQSEYNHPISAFGSSIVGVWVGELPMLRPMHLAIQLNLDVFLEIFKVFFHMSRSEMKKSFYVDRSRTHRKIIKEAYFVWWNWNTHAHTNQRMWWMQVAFRSEWLW